MKTSTFNYFAKQISDNNQLRILKLENQSAKKWYEKTYITVDEIEENVIYGIWDNCSCFFDIKVANIDNIFKTFVTNWVSKYMMKNPIFPITKEECYERLSKRVNSLRVTKDWFYTTKYGIGIFSLFFSDERLETLTFPMVEYLKKLNISFTNEFSEARWVYRFVIKQSVEIHNKLLLEYEK